jgi:uncharacterized membrane protein
MDIQLFLLGIILTVVPLIELRGGLPTSIYAIKDSSPLFILLAFFLIVIINILLIFFIFFFLENLHHKFMKIKIYNKFFEKYLKRIQKKINLLENKEGIFVFITLFLFVAIPFPTTGAYTGTFFSWILGLDKKKSVIAISLGVFVAGIIIFLATTGLITAFS